MESCPLCSGRPARRYCPAKRTHICSICCGTKREVEIDCPCDCIHLKTGRSYEAEKRVPAAESMDRARRFENTFFYQFSPVIFEIYDAILEERAVFPSMMDHDVMEVYRSLTSTMKTLSNGLYYNSLPAGGGVQVSLFWKAKSLLDALMAPQMGDRRALRVSEVLEILEFLLTSAELNTSDRPKSRKYLDWLQETVPDTSVRGEGGRLITP